LKSSGVGIHASLQGQSPIFSTGRRTFAPQLATVAFDLNLKATQVKRTEPSADARDWDAKATEALETARLMPAGQEKTEALKKAGVLRNAADIYGLAKRGRPPK